MARRLALVLFPLVALLPALAARAEPLPGLLSREVMEEAEREAVRQKKDAQAELRRNARALGYKKAQIDQVLAPTMDRRGTFRLTLDDGTVVELPWYRIGFAENRLANTGKPILTNPAGAPARAETHKGGVRLHYGVFGDEVYALALKMEKKLALARDALGKNYIRGAKGGIGAGRVVTVGSRYQARVGDFVDPASPVFDRAAIMRAFAASYRASGGEVGPGLDAQAGDVNTKAAEMRVLSAAYGRPDHPSPGVSGKELLHKPDGTIDPRGGIHYRAISTGEGVWMSARLAAIRARLGLQGATVVAQGWGEVGRAFGMAAAHDGARVIAIQELWNAGGRQVGGVLLHPLGAAANHHEVETWLAEVDQLRASGADLMTAENGRFAPHFRREMDASAVRADIVGVNALGGVLNAKTVPAYVRSGTHRGRRKIIVEGANLAETAAGARLLDQSSRRLLTVPGDLANLGGVHVSDLELVQNVHDEVVSDEAARRSVQGTIRSAWQRSTRLAARFRVPERAAINLASSDAMMKRSLHLKRAPATRLERRVLGKGRR